MAQTCFYYTDDTRPLVAGINASTGVECGDLVALQSGKVVPASALTFASGYLVSGQVGFATLFLGHCGQAKASGLAQVYGNAVSGQIVVSTAGIYNAPLDTPTSLNVGDFVAAAQDGFTTLKNQVVTKVSSGLSMIGVVTADNAGDTSNAQFRIYSSVAPTSL